MNVRVLEFFVVGAVMVGILMGVATYFLAIPMMAPIATPQFTAPQMAFVPAGFMGIAVTAFLLAIATIPLLYVRKS
jgi:membrane protein implicated in regulation of membrane protease activity